MFLKIHKCFTCSNVWRQGFGQLFGQQWGQGFRGPWGQIFGAGTITQPGVVADVTLAANRDQTLDMASLNLPFRDLERYAGRGLAVSDFHKPFQQFTLESFKDNV